MILIGTEEGNPSNLWDEGLVPSSVQDNGDPEKGEESLVQKVPGL